MEFGERTTGASQKLKDNTYVVFFLLERKKEILEGFLLHLSSNLFLLFLACSKHHDL